jgi:hypothetical protein
VSNKCPIRSRLSSEDQVPSCIHRPAIHEASDLTGLEQRLDLSRHPAQYNVQIRGLRTRGDLMLGQTVAEDDQLVHQRVRLGERILTIRAFRLASLRTQGVELRLQTAHLGARSD